MDNIRNFTILLLFPVHTFMIWNDFGSKFYIWAGENKILSTAIVLINPWFMPLLFVLAGMSARYGLKRRTYREFVKQRFWKLGVPFVSGTIFLVPFQTWYARKYFDSYQGGILEHLQYFFTHITDFSGYDGAFTPGQLWFILFLFLISMITLILFKLLPYEKLSEQIEKISAPVILLLFIPIWGMYYLGNFGGFSIGKALALYVLGYYVLSNDAVMDKLEEKIKYFSFICGACTILSAALYYRFSYYGDGWVNFIGWNWILVLLVLGRKYWNKRTKFTDYFNKASYPIYILHQSVLVALAYYILPLCHNIVGQVCLICMGSFVITMLGYSIVRRIPIVRKMIGIQSL